MDSRDAAARERKEPEEGERRSGEATAGRGEAWARTLHEHVAQYMTALTLGLRGLREQCAGSPELLQTVSSLETVAEQMSQAMYRAVEEVRGSAETGDLAGDLARLSSQWSESRVMRVKTNLRGLESVELDGPTREAIVGVVKEAMTNAAKHAGVRAVLVQANARSRRLRVMVTDKGSGFSGADEAGGAMAPYGGDGHGIRGMHEHARSIGARLVIRSAPGVGTTVLLDIPIQEKTK